MSRIKEAGLISSDEHFDVVVIGGGLQGLSSALHLARRGLKTVLLEAAYCGRHASGVNAGGVRTLGRHVAEIPLALAARDELWHNLDEFLGESCGFVPGGQLQVAESSEELESAAARVNMLNGLGFTHERLIGREDVKELVPAISDHVVGGIWADRDGYASPFHVVTAFRRAAQRENVLVKECSPVLRVDMQAGRWVTSTASQRFYSRYVVNAAGAWANEIARQLEEPTPAEFGGLMLMITQKVPPFVNPVLGAVGRPLSFKQFSNGTVLIGGGLRCDADARDGCADVDLSKMVASARTVTDLFPHLSNVAVNRAWAGVEAFMPDHIPVIGPSGKAPGVVHAFGFSAHGFELSPIIGRIVSDLVCDGQTSFSIAPFSIKRFM